MAISVNLLSKYIARSTLLPAPPSPRNGSLYDAACQDHPWVARALLGQPALGEREHERVGTWRGESRTTPRRARSPRPAMSVPAVSSATASARIRAAAGRRTRAPPRTGSARRAHGADG